MGGLLSTNNKRSDSGRNDDDATRGNKKQRLNGVFNFFHGNSDRQGLPLMQLPDDCRVYALSFFDPETVKMMSCVSKQCNTDCWKACTITPRDILETLDDEERDDEEYDSEKFFYEFFYNRADDWAHPFLRVNDVHKLSWIEDSLRDEHERIRTKVRARFDNVVSLDVSFNEPPERDEFGDVCGVRSVSIQCSEILQYLLEMCQNVRVIDSTRMSFGCMEIERNSTVEKVTASHTEYLKILGTEFQHFDSLKELYMDDCTFFVDVGCRESVLINLDYVGRPCYPECYIFQYLKSIERLSIRNARFKSWVCVRDIPQLALIKFVRKAPPSLKWFRSNLTQTNINMLRQDYPDIEFLN